MTSKSPKIGGLGGRCSNCCFCKFIPQFSNAVIGQVVHLFVRDDVLGENNRIDVDKVGAIGRMAGYEYCRTGDRFEIPNGFPK
ncbi:hypothetical protein [Phormidium tenue]|uniref:Uncharacterized protein n=1 Tax=Phormidium tenue NIES-30 TaxID=549789 RepID=A0A1U7J6Q8_9CYAN|nr:hypothetical protein [Phormidium tenue]MBD2233522.1 hypothetical protein [Phormidium tenue FACHB-1052]OKH48632.1 hypothetical protein NIES30_08760 [Phormidium tenue NIES-30]